jgi:CRP/FNR family cyclic AMP-dependent transcriptional regulator
MLRVLIGSPPLDRPWEDATALRVARPPSSGLPEGPILGIGPKLAHDRPAAQYADSREAEQMAAPDDDPAKAVGERVQPTRRSLAAIEPGTYLALLSDANREALLALGRPRGFANGERLMHQGEPGDRVLLLLRGHAKATFLDPAGREVVLNFRGPGDVLGELSFMRSEPRSSSVVAMEPVEAQVLAAAQFRSFLESTPSAALTLIEVLGWRFRDANRARVQFGGSDAIGRIAARLVELCARYGRPTEAGIEISLPLTQADLGGWTACSRAGVGDALRTMRGLGWVETGRRRIIVRDLDALSARAG